MIACDEAVIGPTLPTINSHWRPARDTPWQPSLSEVIAFAEDDIYAVDAGGELIGDVLLVGGPALLHYDGSTWTRIEVPRDDLWGYVSDVWAVDPNRIYVAGDQFHVYDGSTWELQSIDARSVTGSSSSVYASFYDTIYQLSGSEWDTLRTFQDPVYGLAAGEDGSLFVWTSRQLHLWNDPAWQIIDANINVERVLAFSANDALLQVYSAGQKFRRWNGAQLDPVATLDHFVRDMSGTGATNVFAVGESGATYHYDGSTWNEIARGTAFSLNSVAVLGSDRLVAVGESGKVLKYGDVGWDVLREGEPRDAVAIWAESTSRAMLSNYQSTFSFDQGSVTEFAPPTNYFVSELSGTSMENIYAIYYKSVLHFDGASWNIDVDTLAAGQHAIWASPTGAVFTAGFRSVYRRESTWQRLYDGPLAFSQINGRGDRVCAIAEDFVTAREVLAVFDANGWHTYPVPDQNLHDVVWTSDEKIMVAGYRGIYELNGNAIELVTPPVVTDRFNRLFELDGGQIVSFGYDGFAYFDGTFWSLQETEGFPLLVQALSGAIMASGFYADIFEWELQP